MVGTQGVEPRTSTV